MNNSNLELLKTGYEFLAKGDIPSLLSFFAPDIKWEAAEGHPLGGTYTGPDEVVEKFFSRLGSDFDKFDVEPTTFSESGDKVFVQGRYHGKVKATGKTFDCDFMHVWTCRDGKAINFKQYADTALIQRAF